MLALKKMIANRFVIEDRQTDLLGRGGMGEVYHGLDNQTGKAVAIKVLKSSLLTTNSENVARFRREAEALRQLNHPNIVKMITAVEEDDAHYLVMEYVGGGSLRDLINQEGALSLDRILKIALELADALVRTHHLQIIHRDLKPDNVLLAEDGTPRLTDFGVASMADNAQLTVTGMWMGTPHYLSPEACNGEKLDGRTDIWGFGVILYEMLTGDIPFAGDTLMATITAIFRQPVPDLSRRRPDIPKALTNLVYYMLAKERSERILSMRLVAAELEAISRDEPSPGQLVPRHKTGPLDMAQLPPSEFDVLVGQALKLYRAGEWLELADSPLARSALVEPYFLEGEPINPDTRARAMGSMLQWGIDKLKPGGEPNWFASSWRHYNILHSFYIDGRRVSELSELMAITPQTFFSNWRPQAITALAKIMRRTVSGILEEDDRQRFAIHQRYQARSIDEQRVCRMLSVLAPQSFVPLEWFHQLEPDLDITNCLQLLVMVYLVQRDEKGISVRLHPDVHQDIYTYLPLSERKHWHRAAGQWYQKHQQYIQAARHLRQSGDSAAAAKVIINNRQAIFDHMLIDELRSLLANFQAAEFVNEPDTWAQIKIVAGKVAEYVKDVDAAISEYGEALAAPNIYTKARAYYLRAKVLEHRNLDECLAHYVYVVDLVERALLSEYDTPDESLIKLLTRIYIDRAWIYIQERPDWDKAEADLNRTEQIIAVIASLDSATWSDLYNARAGLAFRKGDLKKSITYRLQAWVTAGETQDIELMMKTAYNLGQTYLWLKQYPQGLDYLQKTNELAKKAGNLRMQGLSHKGMGSCYFFQRNYHEAIDHYQEAYQIWLAGKNLNWRAGICHDLAEVYAEIGDVALARKYYEEGEGIAQELRHERYLREFETLTSLYPSLMVAVNERQEAALGHVKKEGHITMQMYMELSEVSKSQAHRDLRELCELELLQKVGKGRATRYVELGDNQPVS